MAGLLVAMPAHAHKPSDAYLRLKLADDGRHQAAVELAIRDLDYALGVDGNGDGLVTWGELRARHGMIEGYVASRLRLVSGGEACLLRPGLHQVDDHSDGAYAVMRFDLDCPPTTRELQFHYGLLFDLDPSHRGLLTVVHGDGRTTTAILSPDQPDVRIPLRQPAGTRMSGFFVRGAEHLLFGFDHLLFLVVLLLPAAHRRAAGRWQPVERWRVAVLDLVKVLTAFTLAHGVSLALAVTGVVDLPARLVESLIALTIGLAALDNLLSWLPAQRWRIAFGFGLIHGLGFASALQPMDLPAAQFALALLAFNLGIEAAQLAVALPLLATTFPIRDSPLYRQGLLPAGSAAAMAVAVFWLVERATGLRLAAL